MIVRPGFASCYHSLRIPLLFPTNSNRNVGVLQGVGREQVGRWCAFDVYSLTGLIESTRCSYYMALKRLEEYNRSSILRGTKRPVATCEIGYSICCTNYFFCQRNILSADTKSLHPTPIECILLMNSYLTGYMYSIILHRPTPAMTHRRLQQSCLPGRRTFVQGDAGRCRVICFLHRLIILIFNSLKSFDVGCRVNAPQL